MRARNRAILFGLIVLSGALVSVRAAPAFACTCLEPLPSATEAAAASDSVFVGTVVAIEPTDPMEGIPSVQARFTVEELVKGEPRDTIAIRTSSQGSACGYGFVIEQVYLVYAYVRQGTLQTGVCTRTSSPTNDGFGNFRGDLTELGVQTVLLTTTITAISTTTVAVGDLSSELVGLSFALPIGAALFVVGAIIIARRRRIVQSPAPTSHPPTSKNQADDG